MDINSIFFNFYFKVWQFYDYMCNFLQVPLSNFNLCVIHQSELVFILAVFQERNMTNLFSFSSILFLDIVVLLLYCCVVWGVWLSVWQLLWNVVVNVMLSFHYEAIGCVNLLAVFSSDVFRLSVLIRYIHVSAVMCVFSNYLLRLPQRYRVIFADNNLYEQNMEEIAL